MELPLPRVRVSKKAKRQVEEIAEAEDVVDAAVERPVEERAALPKKKTPRTGPDALTRCVSTSSTDEF